MKTYRGERNGYAVDVTVNGRTLDPRFDLWQHSPSGFEWGYSGSGPAQLALAILVDHLADNDRALELYQSFKCAVVAGLPWKRWELTSREIEQTLRIMREPAREPGGQPC